jgi:hypothetical protein
MSSTKEAVLGAPGADLIKSVDTKLENKIDQKTEPSEEQCHMAGANLGLLFAGLCLALFLCGLDTAVVSTVSNCKALRI